ncbi:hypothetical protein [Limibacterium fermenti]|uniref:hypothetical protein n=1 Tax=Limibacterium fermenti TaxID=3229863 RepID=UPI003A6E0A94
MKKYSIILVVLLQSFVAAVFSQSTKDGFYISTVKNTTKFEDVNMDNYRSNPKNKNGEEVENPSSEFSSKEKLKKIERELYNEEERNYMLSHYRPRAMAMVRANDGEIVSVTFIFNNLEDPSFIDTKKLRVLRKKIMAENSFDVLFNGQRAASGYIPARISLFKP